MKNHGLFSALFLETMQASTTSTDEAQGRLLTLSQNWQRRDAASRDSLWSSFVEAALGNLGFVVDAQRADRGLYQLFEDFSHETRLAMLYLVEPGADLDDQTVGRFWPARLLTALRERKLNWGILTDGSTWRLYSTKTAKPFEDYVELDLAATLEAADPVNYALFERFFHAESFLALEPYEYETEKVRRLKAAGIKAQRPRRADTTGSGDDDAEGDDADDSPEAQEREAGIYHCRLDLDGEISEAILEARVKQPLLAQVDNVLRYICNGFIADTPKTGDAYTEEERRVVFESSVKLLYRCLFLFYAEARKLLPSEDKDIQAYAPHSMQALCREARKFRWNERSDNHGYDLWQQFKGLVQAVNEGDPSYGVMAYNGGLFDDQEERFLGGHRLRNDYFYHALYWLAYVDPLDAGAEAEYRIPYEDLEVRHLGEMYEAILEYKVRLADTDYIRRRTKKGWQTLPAAGQKSQDGDTRIPAGDIFFGETALERKQSGSYYTPESLVRFLVNKAVITPLRERWEADYESRFAAYVEESRAGFDTAARRGGVRAAEELIQSYVKTAVLTYKVCDPAMGSGHFLVAAANLMADFVVELLSRIEALDGVSSARIGAPNHWRRLITRHCLFGADLNSLAVNLAKLALWLNCFARDHKLTFLDQHLRCGNSLIGLRELAALSRIPERRKETKKAQKEAVEAQEELPLNLDQSLNDKLAEAARAIAGIVNIAEDDTDRQRAAFESASRDLHTAFAPLADLHTGYLMDGSIAPGDYARLLGHFADGKPADSIPLDLIEIWDCVTHLAQRHHFFHWPLEFPDVFDGVNGGFSATVGNPPWDVLEPKTQEFYSKYDVNFRSLDKKEAADRIKELHEQNTSLDTQWASYEALFHEGSAWFKEPAAYTALTKGKIDLYKAFLERFFQVLRKDGHLGIVCPSGLYTDEGAFPLRKLFFEQSRIQCLYCFENRWPAVFEAVDNRFKFILFSTQRGGSTEKFKCAFMQHDPMRLPMIEAKAAEVTYEQVLQFSPEALALVEFKQQEDANVVVKLYTDNPLLNEVRPDSWNFKQSYEFNLTTHRHLFNQEGDGNVLYEGKLIYQFDNEFSQPNYWVNKTTAIAEEKRSYWRLLRKRKKQPKIFDHDQYRVAFRNIAASTNERAFISTVLPNKASCPHTMVVVRSLVPNEVTGEPERWVKSEQATYIASIFDSFACDFLIRMKITTHLDMHIVYSLPIPRLGCGDPRDPSYFWPIVLRALRLICTTQEYADLWTEVFPQIPEATKTALATAPTSYGPAHEQDLRERMAASYANLDATWSPSCAFHDRRPDRRDDGDRAQTRAEIDALVAHLYGLTRDEFAYILDTFPGLRRKELAAFGEFQSKRKVLEEFERFAPVVHCDK
jgi:hypothetical protein